jgi:hypothetical protein
MNSLWTIGALGALLSGCAPDSSAPALRIKGPDFFDQPWPSDLRTIDGHPDMTGFPGTAEYALVDNYISRIETLDGFGTNSPIFLQLESEPASLPKPSQTTRPDSPVLLVDVDTHSPERGRIIPLHLSYQASETTWQPSGLLSLSPVLGFPLRPSTTYALLLTTDFLQPVEGFKDVWHPDYPQRDYYSEIDEVLTELEIPRSRLSFAVRFTTQDPVTELAGFSQRIEEDLSLPALDQQLMPFRGFHNARSYDGKMWLPIWQTGTKPYFSEGGNFVSDEDGRPLVQAWEQVNFTFSHPTTGTMPEAGWPVVIYGHGTGGDHHTFADGSSVLEVSNVLAEAGLAGFSISLPLHSDRGTGMDPTLASFNYLNPDSATATFRQAALDQIYLAELLTSRSHRFGLVSGQSATTDPTRVAYLGHSHGGLIGAIAGPFMGERLSALVLSGAGGGLSSSMATRDAGDIEIQQLLSNVLGFQSDEEPAPSHPLIGMVQTVAECTDPINYAPYWSVRHPSWQTTPVSVLMTEGLLDVQTPPETAEALAAAGGLPVLAPEGHIGDGHRLRDLHAIETPVHGNLRAWDGTLVTGGLAQFPDQGHFAIFEDEDAAALYQHFLFTALQNTPQVDKR